MHTYITIAFSALLPPFKTRGYLWGPGGLIECGIPTSVLLPDQILSVLDGKGTRY